MNSKGASVSVSEGLVKIEDESQSQTQPQRPSVYNTVITQYPGNPSSSTKRYIILTEPKKPKTLPNYLTMEFLEQLERKLLPNQNHHQYQNNGSSGFTSLHSTSPEEEILGTTSANLLNYPEPLVQNGNSPSMSGILTLSRPTTLKLCSPKKEHEAIKVYLVNKAANPDDRENENPSNPKLTQKDIQAALNLSMLNASKSSTICINSNGKKVNESSNKKSSETATEKFYDMADDVFVPSKKIKLKFENIKRNEESTSASTSTMTITTPAVAVGQVTKSQSRYLNTSYTSGNSSPSLDLAAWEKSVSYIKAVSDKRYTVVSSSFSPKTNSASTPGPENHRLLKIKKVPYTPKKAAISSVENKQLKMLMKSVENIRKQDQTVNVSVPNLVAMSSSNEQSSRQSVSVSPLQTPNTLEASPTSLGSAGSVTYNLQPLTLNFSQVTNQFTSTPVPIQLKGQVSYYPPTRPISSPISNPNHINGQSSSSSNNYSSLLMTTNRAVTPSSKFKKDAYKCDFCDKVFSFRDRLTRHKKTHALPQDMPFKCQFPDCGQAFARSDNLKTHEKRHTGLKDKQCELCDYKSSRSDTIKRHYRNKHIEAYVERWGNTIQTRKDRIGPGNEIIEAGSEITEIDEDTAVDVMAIRSLNEISSELVQKDELQFSKKALIDKLYREHGKKRKKEKVKEEDLPTGMALPRDVDSDSALVPQRQQGTTDVKIEQFSLSSMSMAFDDESRDYGSSGMEL